LADGFRWWIERVRASLQTVDLSTEFAARPRRWTPISHKYWCLRAPPYGPARAHT